MTAAGLTWKGYMGDMGNDPARESATCGHPTLNTTDLTQVAEAPSTAVPLGDMYATRHNPFMYFHSIIDSADCGTHVVNMEQNLASDLKSVSTTANLTFITPNLCDDGHDSPCANGAAGGYTSMNAFLTKWVPIILASPAYQADGLLIINFDESNYVLSESASGVTITFPGNFCCGETLGPNLAPYPQSTSAGGLHPGVQQLRWRPDGRDPAVAVYQAGDRFDGAVQPLLDAEDGRKHLQAPSAWERADDWAVSIRG